MVGVGGNNGTTLCATVLANRHNICWHTKSGIQQPNYVGSLLRASTVSIGTDPATGKSVYVPLGEVLPMVHPNDLVLGGWDISGVRMDDAMKRAKVLETHLQKLVKKKAPKKKTTSTSATSTATGTPTSTKAEETATSSGHDEL